MYLAYAMHACVSARGAARAGPSLGFAEFVTPPYVMSSAATIYFDNAASSVQGQGDAPMTQLVMRETTVRARAGFMMLVPPHAPRYLLVPYQLSNELRAYDLLQPDGPGVVVVQSEDYVFTAAVSADGASIFLGSRSPGGLRVYDTAVLLETAARGQTQADNQTAPRAQAPNIKGQVTSAGAAFSDDATRLFVLWTKASAITVHDPLHPELPVLRTLPFSGANVHFSHHQLVCAGGLLAACAGGGHSSPPPSSPEDAWMRRQVKLWHVGVDGEVDACTLSSPDLVDAVAIRPDGGLLAVGLRNGVVRLLSPVLSGGTASGQVAPVELEPMEQIEGKAMVCALCFSHDGSKLVAGRNASDDFVVYDVTSATAVARFVHPKSSGFTTAFFPARDVLVVGGFNNQPCVFHRLLPPAPRVELALSRPANITGSDIVPHDEFGSVVAMVSGSQLEVHTEGGKELLQQDLGEEMFTSLSNHKTAVRLHPGLECVACVLKKTAVVVLSMGDGSELLRFGTGGSCFGLLWSPDGKLLAVPTNDGVRFFSANAGFAQVQHLEGGATIYDFAFDTTATRAATCAQDSQRPGCLTVWDIATWAPLREFKFDSPVLGVSFSQNGDRLAYFEIEDDRVGVLSLETESDEPQCVVKHVNAGTTMMFSPDDSFLLCCPANYMAFDQHRMRVFDVATGTDAVWGELLRTMALPVAGGSLYGQTLGWARLPRAHSLTTDTSAEALQWVLYCAVGKHFVAVDIQAALHAIPDNAWTVDQLAFCVEHQKEHVRTVVESAPHCSNIQHEKTGDTVLHCLARMDNADLIKTWLEKCPHVTPVANVQEQSAVEVAMQLEQADVAQAMWSRLTPSVTSVSASLVMQELMVLSKRHPHLVQPFLLDVEPRVVRTLARFRTELTREAEVCGLPATILPDSSSDGESTSEPESATGGIPSVWADHCPADSPQTLVASRVALLPDLLGDADSSPFHAIVMNCGASVFESKLLHLIVQHKWEDNVRSLRLRSIALYGFAFVTGALAMVTSASNAFSVASSIVDVLQGLVVIIEVSSLGVEAFELAREGCPAYFTGPWNVLDIVSSGFLLVASASHFAGAVDGIRTAGALGVALKCFGMVDYLRAWPATGSLVRMISVIITDMVPFMTILSFAMLGCMLFFTINLSSSPDFDSDSSLGLFRTLVTVYHMTLGIGAGIDTQHASVTTVVVVTLFMSFVVVVLLNLLIAIMGDSYEKVKESERVEAVRERARIVVQEEKRFPKSHRYYRFMHYLEAEDSTGKPDERAWEGVTKRVGQMLSLEVGRLEQEVGGKMIELNHKIDNKFELLELNQLKMEHKLEMILDSLK